MGAAAAAAVVQFNEVLHMKLLLGFLEEIRDCLTTALDEPLLSSDALFNLRYTLIKHLITSSDSLFGFSLSISISGWLWCLRLLELLSAISSAPKKLIVLKVCSMISGP